MNENVFTQRVNTEKFLLEFWQRVNHKIGMMEVWTVEYQNIPLCTYYTITCRQAERKSHLYGHDLLICPKISVTLFLE